jgi:hypothetical protein
MALSFFSNSATSSLWPVKSRCKETSKSFGRTIHLVERDNPDDESAELVWPRRPNLHLVLLYSQFKRTSKKKLNLHLMLLSVIKYLTN